MREPAWVESSAHFDGPLHRVWLRRRLTGSAGPLVVILHNPSLAGADLNDPTARSGLRLAVQLDACDLVFVNVVTAIATDANDLAAHADPIGRMADEALQVAAAFCDDRAGVLVAAWGAPKGRAATREIMWRRFRKIAAMGLPLNAFRVTKNGHPEHLLYLPNGLTPQPWTPHYS